MNKIKIICLCLFAAAAGNGVIAQENGKEQLIVPLSDPGKAFKLNVGLTNGSITITGYDGKDILIDAGANTNKNKNEDERSGGMRKISSRSLSITASEKNNQVDVGTDRPNNVLQLSIKIPKGASNIKLETINNGDIDVSNTGGELEINNVNGSIRLKSISGSVVATTVNGDLTATFTSVDAKAPMAFSTLNGNVDVSFPAALKANMRLKSEHGSIYTDFDITVERSQGVAEKTKEGNMYKVNINEWVNGKIGGGGPEIMMSNLNGNIYARKSKVQ